MSADIDLRGSEPLPRVNRFLLRWFTLYVRRFLARNFHGVRVLRLSALTEIENVPLLVCMSHPSWWDPLMGVYLSQTLWPERRHFAPIAAAGLAKYRFFERLGFFGIDREGESRGARFLRIGRTVLSQTDGAFWVTPQGMFTDVRRPVVLEPGVGHLAHHAGEFAMLPVALEYGFWNERFPEAFLCLGKPFSGCGADRSAAEWNGLFTKSLQETVDALSRCVESRRGEAFETLLRGRAGVGGIYDMVRAARAKLRGRRWQPEHGEI